VSFDSAGCIAFELSSVLSVLEFCVLFLNCLNVPDCCRAGRVDQEGL
jgi:hypothetical protein